MPILMATAKLIQDLILQIIRDLSIISICPDIALASICLANIKILMLGCFQGVGKEIGCLMVLIFGVLQVYVAGCGFREHMISFAMKILLW